MYELYLGYTLFEYAFMVLYMAAMVGTVAAYVKIQDLKEQRDYYKYLSHKMIENKERIK
jgi:hypothetical protein